MRRSISWKHVLLLLAVPVALLFLCGLLLVAYLLLADPPALLSGDDARRTAPLGLVDGAAADAAAGMTLSEALEVTADDARPAVREEMGPPDAFTLHFEQLEGKTVRWETWSYFDFQTRFDFIDGELLWRTELEPVPDGSIYAHFHDPADFQAGMSLVEVKALLGDQNFAEIDLAAGDIDGGSALAGDQILLGFQDERLVFVETVILSPDERGEPLTTLAATSTPDVPPPILEDDFSGPSRLEIAYDTAFRAFDTVDGRGRMSFSGEWGGMMVTYDSPRPQDFMARADFDVTDVAANGSVGFVFRAQGQRSEPTDFYVLSIKPVDREVELSVVVNGEEVANQSAPFPEDAQPDNGIYQLVLICNRSEYVVLLNDQYITSFSDTQITEPGFLGFTILHHGPLTVFVDDLVVYSISTGE